MPPTKAPALRSVLAIGTIVAIGLCGSFTTAAAAHTSTASPRHTTPLIGDPLVGPNTRDEARHSRDQLNLTALQTSSSDVQATRGVFAPRAGALANSFNAVGLQKEVFGFAPYWALSRYASWNYDLMSTVAYFGIPVNWDGTFDTASSGWAGFNSQNMINMVNQAHASGDRVVLVLKGTGTAAVNDVVTVPAETQAVITNTIGAIGFRNLDGVNVDFEGDANPTYPNIQAGLTNFMTLMSKAVHARWPNAFVTIDTYTGSASWDQGLMNITALAPVVDAMFIMAYDMSFSNMPGQAGPNAPLTGWTYNDTLSVTQYLTKAPASKIILGVPWYGYMFDTTSNTAYGTTSNATAVDYSHDVTEIACAPNVSQAWDQPAQSPWAAWYSKSSGDPCGDNRGSWEELYYDNVQSLGAKYDLVNRSGIRGMGIWALGYEGGATEIWSELSTYFSCPASVTLNATVSTTEFNLGLSAGGCSVASFDVQQRDTTLGTGWVALKVPAPANGQATAVAEGFPGSSYDFRVRAHSTAGVTSAWAPASTAVSTNATFSHAFKALYTLDAFGGVQPADSPPLAGSGYWAGWRIARAAHALPGSNGESGAVLDGFGGLHGYGQPLSAAGSPYWGGWDIARDFSFLPDGSGGYVLDGFGGLHPFGVNGHAAPPFVTGGAYWPGFDIARRVVVFSDGTGGYVLDGFGGVHSFGIGAPAPPTVSDGAYWGGWYIARDIVLIPGTHAGYVLDGFGGLHGFLGAATVQGAPYWAGWDIARDTWLLPTSTLAHPAGYVLDGFGGLHPFGGAPAIASSAYWPGADLAIDISGL